MRRRRFLSYAVALSALVGSSAGPAAAQTYTPLGASPAAVSGKLSSFAYDDRHDVYLHVYEQKNGLGNYEIVGRFISGNGAIAGSEFQISTNGLTFGVQPKVAYSRSSASADVFLVTYASDQAKLNNAAIFGRLVRYTGAGSTRGSFVGNPIPISPNSLAVTKGVYQLVNDVAFNPITSRFLVAWEEYPGPDVLVRLINPDGTVPGNAVNITPNPGSQGAPSVAFDWRRNRFMVAFTGDNPQGGGYGTFGYLLDGTSASPVSSLIVMSQSGTDESALAYLPERDGFLVAWTTLGAPRVTSARFVPSTYSSGALPTPEFLAMASTRSIGKPSLDYDYMSRRILMAGMRAMDPAVGDIAGMILDAGGTPLTGSFKLSNVTAAISGTYNPTVHRARNGVIALSYVNDYATAQFERLQFPVAQTAGPDYCVGCTPPPADADGDGVPDTADACPTVFAQTANGCPVPAVATSGDFTGDGRPELVWQNVTAAGQVYAWFLTPSLTLTGGAYLVNDGSIPSGWSLVGTGDLSGDGKPDLLWQNQQTGQVLLFIMNGANKVAEQTIAINPVWTVVATGDLNGDKKTDIVWQNVATGQVYVWFMSPSGGWASTFNPFQGGFIQDAQLNPSVVADKTWRVVGVSDVNNDGKTDLIWQHPTGQLSAWLLNGIVVSNTVAVPFSDPTWKVRAVGDYNGDGHPDLIFQKTDTGDIAAWLLNGSSLLQSVPIGRVNLIWRVAGAK